MFEQRWYRVNTPFAGNPVKGFFARMSRVMIHNADAWNHVDFLKRERKKTMSKELAKTYDPHGLEDRIYQKWLDKKYFHAEVDRSRKPFTIVIPPPNITGQLHMGHALDNTMQDILIRFKRMQGYNALWQPGTDHASIATEVLTSMIWDVRSSWSVHGTGRRNMAEESSAS